MDKISQTAFLKYLNFDKNFTAVANDITVSLKYASCTLYTVTYVDNVTLLMLTI